MNGLPALASRTAVGPWSMAGVSRHGLCLAALLLGIANVGFPPIYQDVVLSGFWQSLFGLFGLSAVVWVAVGAIVAITMSVGDATARKLDIVLCGMVALACLIPTRSAAATVTSGFAIYIMVTARPRTPLFRAAAVALSVLAALFWGATLLATAGPPLLGIDVALAGTLAGLRWEGNLLYFVSDNPLFAGKAFMVAPACSSLHGISIALLGAVVVTQFYDLRIGRSVLLWGLAGVVATVAVNIARLAALARYPESFEWIHIGPGATIAGGISMVLVMATNLGGNWRAITRNA